MRHSHGAFWTWFSRFLYPPSALSITSFFSNSGSLLHYPCDPSMEYFEADSFLGVIDSLVFLIFPWFFQYFFMCQMKTLFFIRTSLPLYYSFIQGWFALTSFENCPLFCVLPPKIQKSYLFPHLKKKTQQRNWIWNNKCERTKFT